MKDSIESFTTNRLVAERISQAHFDLVCRLHRDRDVMKTLSAIDWKNFTGGKASSPQ